MIAETIHEEEEEIETGESAGESPWDRALSTKGMLVSESNSRDEQLDTASPELINLLFYCWMMHKKKEPLRLFFLQKLLAQEEEKQ